MADQPGKVNVGGSSIPTRGSFSSQSKRMHALGEREGGRWLLGTLVLECTLLCALESERETRCRLFSDGHEFFGSFLFRGGFQRCSAG